MAGSRKNKNFNPNRCGVTHFLNLIGGKWKVLILYAISKKCNRFSLLQKAIPQISKQMLVNQLRELEEDLIIDRMIYAEIPPKVEYGITVYGKSILPVIYLIEEWGLDDLKKQSSPET